MCIRDSGVLTVSERSYGAQIGAGALAFEGHRGLQLGVAANYAKSIHGAQIGLANIAEEAKGVQIGLFNHAKRLRGVQIGLVNHAEDGVLPWTAIINMGFGDEPEQNHRDDYAKRRGVPKQL